VRAAIGTCAGHEDGTVLVAGSARFPCRCAAGLTACRRFLAADRGGVDIVTVAGLAGLAAPETTRTYERPSAAGLQRAVSLLTAAG